MKLLLSFLLLSSFAVNPANNKVVDKDIKKEEKTKVLTIYNVEEYIDEDLLVEFKEFYEAKYNEKIEVIYNTYESNEIMLNNIKTGKTQYDLICPSDYTIQKMLNEDLLIKFDMNEDNLTYTNVENYNKYASPYIKELFIEKGWQEYSIPYMWGTMGIIYNIDTVENHEDMHTWLSLWDKEYYKRFTIKNSVRDTYFVGIADAYHDELIAAKAQYELYGDAKAYNKRVTEIFNYCDDEHIKEIEKSLISLKNNAYGLEVDSGKNDVSTGKIDINFAWSGDAVYAIELAAENDINLNYVIPDEGSNIWFDGWVMPKGANKELAQIFVNFICNPASAIKNMEYIGYTSAIAGEDVFNYMNDSYAGEGDNLVPFDLSYFFNGTMDSEVEPIIYINEEDRYIISAQYPTEEEIIRCAIMQDFGDQNTAVLKVWSRIKVIQIPTYVYIVSLVVVIAIASLYYGNKIRKNAIRKKRMNKHKKVK